MSRLDFIDDDEKKEKILSLREDWDNEYGDQEDMERPSDEELWQEYKEEIDGSGYEGTDYIKSMGLEDNYENDDF
jgi:hypothetical protein